MTPPAPPLAINLGTGRGYTVLEIIEAFARASGRKIPYKITKRRPGDIATCYARTALAKKLFGWKAKRNLADMCADAWRWQSQNPNGY
jgi:UDP-glucose 4-epimerase